MDACPSWEAPPWLALSLLFPGTICPPRGREGEREGDKERQGGRKRWRERSLFIYIFYIFHVGIVIIHWFNTITALTMYMFIFHANKALLNVLLFPESVFYVLFIRILFNALALERCIFHIHRVI